MGRFLQDTEKAVIKVLILTIGISPSKVDWCMTGGRKRYSAHRHFILACSMYDIFVLVFNKSYAMAFLRLSSPSQYCMKKHNNRRSNSDSLFKHLPCSN